MKKLGAFLKGVLLLESKGQRLFVCGYQKFGGTSQGHQSLIVMVL